MKAKPIHWDNVRIHTWVNQANEVASYQVPLIREERITDGDSGILS